ITIGNELISGRVLDLNSWYAAGRLTACGLCVTRVTTVGDDTEKLSKAITEALADSHFVIITGGLGSTEDDITNEIVAQALNRPLCLDEQMLEQIKSFVDARGIEMSPSLEKMAWMPKESNLLNPEGNVCGFSLIENKVRLYFLPGVPDQMRYLIDKFVLPELLLHCETLPVLRHRALRVYGVSEPNIAELLKGLPKRGGNIILGFYPRFPENHLTMSLRGQDEPSVVAELDVMEQDIRAVLGPYIFAAGNQTMEEVVGRMLKERGLSVSVAESCTGGLIGNLLTNVPGSSNYFQGGVTVYSNPSKIDLLGVSSETIERFGAVSEQTAREMAEGVKRGFKTDMGIAVTGIAGPEGGSENKPVGTVYIALATREGTLSRRYRFWGTRRQVKVNTAMMALDWVRRYLNEDSFISGL
ncbi:MAG: competence/damage-inducible protein A, partial [Pseudomonadota bacterium]